LSHRPKVLYIQHTDSPTPSWPTSEPSQRADIPTWRGPQHRGPCQGEQGGRGRAGPEPGPPAGVCRNLLLLRLPSPLPAPGVPNQRRGLGGGDPRKSRASAEPPAATCVAASHVLASRSEVPEGVGTRTRGPRREGASAGEATQRPERAPALSTDRACCAAHKSCFCKKNKKVSAVPRPNKKALQDTSPCKSPTTGNP